MVNLALRDFRSRCNPRHSERESKTSQALCVLSRGTSRDDENAIEFLHAVAARLVYMAPLKSVADYTPGFVSTINHGAYRPVSCKELLLSHREYLGRRPNRHTCA